MGIQTKKVNGQILGRENRELLATVQVEISLITPTNPNDRHQCKVFITTENYRPEFLTGEAYILKLKENISGEVSLSIPQSHTPYKERIIATLQDSSWVNLEWFNSL